jgi:hypothetical protein
MLKWKIWSLVLHKSTVPSLLEKGMRDEAFTTYICCSGKLRHGRDQESFGLF